MKAKKKLPQKQTVNLAMREQTHGPFQVVPMFLIVFALALIFGKFAVADRLLGVAAEQEHVAALEQQLQELETQTADFDAVREEYAKYSNNWMTDEERATVDLAQAVSLVEDELMGDARVLRYSVAENTVSVDLGGVTLATASDFVSRLEARDDVAGVAVYTANNQLSAGAGSEISLTIRLQNEESILLEQKRAAQKAAEAQAAEGGDT